MSKKDDKSDEPLIEYPTFFTSRRAGKDTYTGHFNIRPRFENVGTNAKEDWQPIENSLVLAYHWKAMNVKFNMYEDYILDFVIWLVQYGLNAERRGQLVEVLQKGF